MAKNVAELHEEGKKKKKKKILPIVLITLGSILLIIALTILFFYIKASGMSKNAVKVIDEMLYVPDELPESPELVDIDDPEFIPNGNDPDPRLDDPDLDPYNGDIFYDPDTDPWYFNEDEPYVPGTGGGSGGGGGYTPTPIYNTPAINADVVNILVIGTDRRTSSGNGRSDSMMLVSYNKKKRSAKLVSFLRDSWVYIPGRNKWNRLNAAYSFGGPGMLINTVNYNFGLDIKRYIVVDFNAVKSLVDAIGGLDLELTVNEIQYINRGLPHSPKIPLVAGVHHLNGSQVLRHSRNRTVGNIDWERTSRQRRIIYALLERAKKEPNAVALMSLLYQLTDKLDSNMQVDEMVNLVVDVVFGGSGFNLENRACPFEKTWKYAWEGRMAVIHVDIAANKLKLRQFLYGD